MTEQKKDRESGGVILGSLLSLFCEPSSAMSARYKADSISNVRYRNDEFNEQPGTEEAGPFRAGL